MENLLVDCNTSAVQYTDRYKAWSEGLTQTFGPLSFEPDASSHFFGSVRVKERDKLRFNLLGYQGQRVQRRAQDVRQLSEGFYTFTCPISGQLEVTHDYATRLLVPAQVYLFNHAIPYSTTPLANYWTASISIPETALRCRIPSLRSFYSLQADASGAHGQLLKALASHISDGLDKWTDREFLELCERFFDLVALMFGQERNATTSGDSAVRFAHLDAAERFIRANACDPELGPAQVAQGCRVSLSYLHSVFRGRKHSVEETIFIERLEHARRLFDDPKFNGTMISAAAYICGFSHPAHFSRSFKRRFGMSPREYRSERHSDIPSMTTSLKQTDNISR